MTPDGMLPSDVRELFLSIAIARTYVAGQELFDSQSAPTAMYGVLDGRVRVSLVDQDGRQPVAATFGPGQWFGETPLLDSQARAFRAEAQEDCKVAVVPSRAFLELVGTNNQALLAVTRLVCARYRQTLAWGEDLLLHSLPTKLAGRLLTAQAPQVHLSQEDLASQLGVSRATVNRQLRIWSQQGLLRLGYRYIEVLDQAALEAIRHSR